MCWMCKKERLDDCRHNTSENIKYVFKLMDIVKDSRGETHLISSVLNYKYELNTLNEVQTIVPDLFETYKNGNIVDAHYEIYEGYHSYSLTKLPSPLQISEPYIVIGYIPKNTIYYEDVYGEIVSENIVLTKVCENLEDFLICRRELLNEESNK